MSAMAKHGSWSRSYLMPLNFIDKDTYIRAFMCTKSAAAMVLIRGLFNDDSWACIETLWGLSDRFALVLA